MAEVAPEKQQDFDPLVLHDGNTKMRDLMSASSRGNPTTPFLNTFRANYLRICNLFAIGTKDEHGQPWTSLWGGEDGAVSVRSLKILAIKSLVAQKHDPVITRLLQINPSQGVFGRDQKISALGIRLASRDRVKLAGTVMGAVLEEADTESVASTSLVLHVDSSLGNCPKYLNIKEIRPVVPDPIAHPEPLPLPAPALALIEQADCFFITAGLSTNHRGGSHGFVRVLSNKPDAVQLAYPEYSGNRLYQTLGNLIVEPLAGIIIPDFTTGDALYATCESKILAGPEAAALMPRTNLVVVLTVIEARFVQRALPFRAIEGEPSPYNPPLRFLTGEDKTAVVQNISSTTATLVDRLALSDDVSWLRFQTDQPITYKIGQHAALSFEKELGLGYSHMREDDPSSLNDDLNRSFTITSAQSAKGENDHFEMVIRNVGRVTKHLLKQNIRSGVSCSILGFGGSFAIDREDNLVGFIAGGVGITPLLCQVQDLDMDKLHIVWTINQKDIAFAGNLFKRWHLRHVHLYVSGAILEEQNKALSEFEADGHHVERRRLAREDLTQLTEISKWYLCAGPALQKSATEWLQGKEVIAESFDF